MSYGNYEFPYTRTYDGDLGFLIKEYKDLKKEYLNLLSDIEYVKDFANTLDKRVADAIEKAMDIFIASVNKTLAVYDKRIKDSETSVENFQTILDSFSAEIYGMRKLILTLENELKSYTDISCEIVYTKCKLLIAEWSKTLPPVIDPTDGNLEDINTALQHIYDFLIDGITALELDNLNLTAEYFDSLEITAKDFDVKASDLLNIDMRFYMLSPFSGNQDLITNVVNQLAQLHMKAITAQYLDDTNLPVTYFESQKITAYNFDWNNPMAE